MSSIQIVAALGLTLVLGGIFVLLFVLYRKTPAPKGMEDLRPDTGLCEGCSLASSCELKSVKKESCDKEKTEEKK